MGTLVGKGRVNHIFGEHILMNLKDRRREIALLNILFTLLLAGGFLLPSAQAQEGHAGEMKEFISDKEALKTMLPDGARISKRKQQLDAAGIQWAGEIYSVDLDNEVHTYFLARDRDTNAVIGAAIITEAGYRHGEVRLAVGIDNAQDVTQAAVLGVNEKYTADFASTIGTGLIAQFRGMSMVEFTDRTNELASKNNAAGIAARGLRDAAVLLVTLLRGVE